MSAPHKSGQDFSLRGIGIWVCIVTIVALFGCIIFLLTDEFPAALLALAIQAPVPLMALGLFCKSGKHGQVHAVALMIPYILLMMIFWPLWCEGSKDAQAGIAFLFGSIYVQLICCMLLAIFSAIYFICLRVKAKSRGN